MRIPDIFRIFKPRDMPVALPDIQNNVRDSGTVFSFGTADSGERVDERSAMQIATVYACVRLLAESVAQLPLHLYRYTANGKGKEMATDHPLYWLLHDIPNPEMTSFTWRETMMTHLLLYGNSYSQIIRDGRNGVVSIYPLLPENVEVDRDEHGDIYYIYHAYTDETPGEKNKDLYFRRDEILHIPGLGFNGLVGFSPIAMMKNSLGAVLAVEKYGSSFFKNGAQPIGVLEHPGILKDPEKIRRQWQETYGGAGKAHRVAVVEEGMSYKPISLPPEDSQFLSTRQFNVEEICRIFNVPPHMVQDLQRSTFNNIEHQAIQFVKHSLMPWLIKIEMGIIKDVLVDNEQHELYPKFNVDGLLRGDFQSRMNGYSIGINSGIYSFNEVRDMENLDPMSVIENGDKHVMNGSYVLTEDIGKNVGANAVATREKLNASDGAASSEEQEADSESDNMAGESNGSGEEQKARETPGHARRKAERKAARQGKTTKR